MNGKTRCKILKDIRRQIAESNDISYVTSECKYQGDCKGACPPRPRLRLPLIPDYNTAADVEKSQEMLSALGITRFDRFSYRTKK